MTLEPEFVRATLDWCNARRAEKGKKALKRLPKGKKGDPLSCPCGKATGLSVGSITYSDPKTFEQHTLPKVVGAFVTAFDFGGFPQYEEAK